MKTAGSLAFRSSVLVFSVLALSGGRSYATFANLNEVVPVDRLVKNLSKYIKAHPKDAAGVYTLGRVHSLAFAQMTDRISIVPARGRNKLPYFDGFQTVIVKRVPQPGGPHGADKKSLWHLSESVRLYARSTELDSKNALYFLGLGWMLEQGAPFAPRLKSATPSGALKPPAEVKALDGQVTAKWLARSLTAYRQAYRLRKARELAQPAVIAMGDSTISIEAGEGILRILGTTAGKLSEKDIAEIADIKKTIAAMKNKPQMVTPILVPLGREMSLRSLLDSNRSVKFDLAGDNLGSRWPWVRANTGILVWDPLNTGVIKSGRQLFGSATWWMLWGNGYDALAALDDNGDGWLRGDELRGIRIWRDADGNAVSDRGEVSSLADCGIAAISTRGSRNSDGYSVTNKEFSDSMGRWFRLTIGHPNRYQFPRS